MDFSYDGFLVGKFLIYFILFWSLLHIFLFYPDIQKNIFLQEPDLSQINLPDKVRKFWQKWIYDKS